jgi:hypothetical protein
MSRQRLMVMVATLAMVGIAGAAVADSASGAAGAVLKMKSGACKFTLVQSDGVRPAAKAELKLTDVQNAERTITAQANALGVCSAEISEARYIVAVNGRNLGILETSATGSVSEYRIILPGTPAIVAGQAETVATGFTFLGVSGAGGVALAIGTGVAAAGGLAVAGDYADVWDIDGIDDSTDKDDDDDDDTPPPVQPPPSGPPPFFPPPPTSP